MVDEPKYRQETSHLVHKTYTSIICCTVRMIMINTTYLGSIEIKATLRCTLTIFNELILVIISINLKGACKLEDFRDNDDMECFT